MAPGRTPVVDSGCRFRRIIADRRGRSSCPRRSSPAPGALVAHGREAALLDEWSAGAAWRHVDRWGLLLAASPDFGLGLAFSADMIRLRLRKVRRSTAPKQRRTPALGLLCLEIASECLLRGAGKVVFMAPPAWGASLPGPALQIISLSPAARHFTWLSWNGRPQVVFGDQWARTPASLSACWFMILRGGFDRPSPAGALSLFGHEGGQKSVVRGRADRRVGAGHRPTRVIEGGRMAAVC